MKCVMHLLFVLVKTKKAMLVKCNSTKQYKIKNMLIIKFKDKLQFVNIFNNY